ncbi:hypothetical protein [Prevotella intermedia]|uniref:DUF4138 domain-containing protein n=1 Tax=Prevotella intermedia TaxID=28131 RepID=A0A3R8HKP7_PREIN|nr:hypothetical protein [Prevotella intermedia]RQE06986.1 hypothetical protein D2S53_00935 [Prevotella intermedia]RRF88448.1 hypothetical protein D2S45_00935 [Prevotella intermedia]
MRRIATLLLLLLTTLWASAQNKQTYFPDFKKGQTVIYEHLLKKTYQRNSDNTTVDGLELYSPFATSLGGFNFLDMVRMLPTGDSISSKFSLKVLEATPYAYIMEFKLIDVGLPKELRRSSDTKDFLEIINLTKNFKMRLMMSRKLGEWVVINTNELYKQFLTEGRKRKLSIFEGEDEGRDEERIAEMQRRNAINIFFYMFVPGFKVFTESYSLRCEGGHREEGELKEEKGSFKFVSDVTKGKGREMNFKMNMDMYSSLYEPDNDTYASNVDSISIDSIEMDYVDVDTIVTDEEDSLLYDDGKVLCKAQNVIDVKMDKKSWLEKYENTVTINYPNGVGTIYQVVRRRKN